MNIVWLFQKDSKKLQKYSNEKSSCFIIDTIKLIDVAYNLHKVKKLVQIDLKWMKRNQAQIKKRVNHLEQYEKTITYDLRCVDLQIKMLIYNRQNYQARLMNMTLKLKTFQVKELIRDIEDDDNDKDDHIKLSDSEKWWLRIDHIALYMCIKKAWCITSLSVCIINSCTHSFFFNIHWYIHQNLLRSWKNLYNQH